MLRFRVAGLDRVVPFRVELIAGDVEALHCGIADFDALLIAARVERALDFEAGVGGGCADQLDHGKAIGERSAAPVLRDMAEQAVLDLVPLRCAGRIVVDVDHEPGLVGELLQFEFPEPHPRPIRAAAVRHDRQFSRIRIALSSHAFAPATDRLHGELGGVAGDPDADEAGIGGHIVHAIRHDLAELLVLEVVYVHAPRVAFRAIIGSAVLEVADQLLLLRVDGDDGLLLGLRRNDFRVDVFELGIAVGMLRAFIRLAIELAREPEFTNSVPTVSALIGCPISVSAAASFSMLFDTQIKGRMGSPSVAGSTRRLSAGTSPGSASDTARRPPPARRTRPFGSASRRGHLRRD